MKEKIRIIDPNGKVLEKEFNVPNKFHFEAQKKFRSSVFRDRTKYNRKKKHRKKFDDQEVDF